MSGSGATTGGFQLAYHWEHDDASRIVRMETPDGFTDFDYDDTDQLIGADHEYTTGDNLLTDEIHEWDANGNPEDSTVLDRQVIMDDHNRLRYVYTENSTKVQIYSYDNEGNRTRWYHYEKINGLPPWTLMRQVNYEWDFRNRLTAVRFYVGGQLSKQVEYEYDAYDRRLTRRVDANGNGSWETQQRFVYDTNVGDPSFAEVIMILDEGNDFAEESRYLQGAVVDQVFAEVDADTGGNVNWLLPDHQGTIRDVFDYTSADSSSTGSGDTEITNHLTYDSFGQLIEVDDPSTVGDDSDGSYDGQFTYTGRDWDADAELYYYRARWYDPLAQRFVNEDSLGFYPGDANLSRYTGNSPINFVDPSGNFQLGNDGRPVPESPVIITFPNGNQQRVPKEKLMEVLTANPRAKVTQVPGISVDLWWDHYWEGKGRELVLDHRRAIMNQIESHDETHKAKFRLIARLQEQIIEEIKFEKKSSGTTKKLQDAYGINFVPWGYVGIGTGGVREVFGGKTGRLPVHITRAPLLNVPYSVSQLIENNTTLYSLGKSRFFGQASYTSTQRNNRIEVKMAINWTLTDEFKDAADIFSIIDGMQEFKGGTPYNIKASLSDTHIQLIIWPTPPMSPLNSLCIGRPVGINQFPNDDDLLPGEFNELFR